MSSMAPETASNNLENAALATTPCTRIPNRDDNFPTHIKTPQYADDFLVYSNNKNITEAKKNTRKKQRITLESYLDKENLEINIKNVPFWL